MDDDQYATDLMKCISSLKEIEKHAAAPDDVGSFHLLPCYFLTSSSHFQYMYDVVLLGGLSGRLDQTIHTLSYLHKLRKTGRRVFAVTDENIGWVLDEVCRLWY